MRYLLAAAVVALLVLAACGEPPPTEPDPDVLDRHPWQETDPDTLGS